MEPQQSNQPIVPLKDAHPRKLIYLGIIVVVIMAAAGFYAAQNRITGGTLSLEKLAPVSLYNEVKNGNWSAARAQRESILQDPNASEQEKALVKIQSTRVNFKITADVNDILKSIAELKTVFLDPEIDMSIRILALNKLAFAYCASGRDPLAFAELYKDEPFNKYLVANDPDASARNLAEWSYGIKPTAFAAARIARWYSQQYANDDKLTDAVREEYKQTAIKYLSLGEDLIGKEIASSPELSEIDPMRAEYYFWHARDTAYLSSRGDKEYLGKYRGAFEDTIAFIEKQGSASSEGSLAFSRYYYARYMVKNEKDRAGAKVQLDILAKELSALDNPLTSSFIRMVRNESKNKPNGDVWRGMQNMVGISKDYDTFIAGALAIPSSKTALVGQNSSYEE